MDFASFLRSQEDASCPSGVSAALRALWWDGRGDWEKAHQAVQDESDADSAWVHAYLHRKEGDLSNAGYWYRQAKQVVFRGSLEEEWESIVRALIAK